MSTRALEELSNAIFDCDEQRICIAVEKNIRKGTNPLIVLDRIAQALHIVGKKFEEGELFLPHLVIASQSIQKAVRSYLEPALAEKGHQKKNFGTFVIGTVQGDIHDIGKSIVAALLFASGFEVYDLGVDVPPMMFVEKAKEVKADIVGASSLLGTTMPRQKDIVKAFVDDGSRAKLKLMFGGAPVTEEWVRKIGGDAYAEDAVEAVRMAKKLLGRVE
jgi:corrinoid protein of di/trimethylamine methyltransferase